MHVGCPVRYVQASQRFICPCHGGIYNFQGQVIGQTVNIGNLFNMTYKPILVPGAEIVGFEQDIAYIREVQ